MTHRELCARAAHWLRTTRRCWCVLVERGGYGGSLEIADAIGWRGPASILVECKVSLADFRADLKKPQRNPLMDALGTYRYYMAPIGLLSVEEIPANWGFAEVGERAVFVRRQAPVRHLDNRAMRAELGMLVSEVGRYQKHGLTYPKLLRVPSRPTGASGVAGTDVEVQA